MVCDERGGAFEDVRNGMVEDHSLAWMVVEDHSLAWWRITAWHGGGSHCLISIGIERVTLCTATPYGGMARGVENAKAKRRRCNKQRGAAVRNEESREKRGAAVRNEGSREKK